MIPEHNSLRFMILYAGLLILLTAAGNTALAHCDTLDGPVVKTARLAFAAADVTPVLKWVSAEDEEEIRAAFQNALSVRSKGAEARELADTYFFETLVRLHRAGEGAPYTGLQSSGAIDPAVAMADTALETGSVQELADVLARAMINGLNERFEHARETRKHSADTVDAGREFVEAYVAYTHYVEGLHLLIKGNTGHHAETGTDHKR